MAQTSRIIQNLDDVAALCALVRNRAMPFTAVIADGKKRTNPQNRTIHMWYEVASKELGDSSTAVRAECKLIHGVPILRRDNPIFKADYDQDFRPLPYEVKLRIFETLDPAITSLMQSKQLKEYMDEMVKRYAQMGITLPDPDMKP